MEDGGLRYSVGKCTRAVGHAGCQLWFQWNDILTRFLFFQMKEMIAKDVQDKGLLVSAANTGSIEVWEVVVAVVKATDPVLLEKVFYHTSYAPSDV